jgi:hypothetical protein
MISKAELKVPPGGFRGGFLANLVFSNKKPRGSAEI